ncbi:MAG: rod shape-determining protein MreC [Proteocatella sp.]
MKFKFSKNKGVSYGISGIAILIVVVFVLNEINGNSLVQKLLSPMLGNVSKVTYDASEFVDGKYIHDEDKNRIKALEESNSKLRKDLIENSISQEELKELKELKKMLKLKDEKIYDEYMTADIISKDGNGFYSSFLISAGKKDGITEGSLVLSGNGLAGVVETAYENYSKVVSVLDSKMSMSFRIARDENVTGIASQNLDSKAFENMENDLLKAYCYETDKEILVGDIVITSGMGIYPEGIEIGEVYEIVEDTTNLLKYIKIKPYTNFNDLDKVMIIKTRTMN